MIVSLEQVIAASFIPEEHTYVVWPDGTVCLWEDLEDYGHMSDDYRLETTTLCVDDFIDQLEY